MNFVSVKLEKSISSKYKDFLDALTAAGFAGEVESRASQRVVLATDNSIYQALPQAVVFPTPTEDVKVLAQLMAKD